ncbi:MAG: hypothetical protein NUW22_05510 [Acidobacteria bacterium]|nr:hypothetical protein [Acidobacteriota bacterium]
MTDPRLTLHSAQGASRHLRFSALVTPDLAERARVDTNAWIKRLRLVPYASGAGTLTMRERFVFRDDSLWWFTELYLQKMRQLDRAVLTVLALDAAWASHAPARLVIDGAGAATAAAARAFGAARGVAVDVAGGAPAPPGHGWAGAQVGVSAALSRLRGAVGPGRRLPAPGPIAAFVHTAFWRGAGAPDGGREGYIGPVLDALDRAAPGAVRLVGVGPARNFTARRWWHPVAADAAAPSITPIEHLAPWSSLRASVALWRQRRALADALVSGPGIREAAIVHGCDLWAVLEPELRATAEVQWPWSARAMDEAGAAIDALGCRTVVTYAEAGGWGRALMLEARRRGVRSAGLQHGFIYRHWLNYLHEPDEFQPAGPAGSGRGDAGFPAPDLTLVFDRYAEAHLRDSGAFPPDRLVVTGSPRLDDLLARMATFTDADRAAARGDAGAVQPGRKLAVLAAKFTEVRDVLPALVDAMRRRPDIHLAIKAHPAEVGSVYAPYLHNLPNITIVGADADLARLLAAADAVVTRNSTVALDALVIGLPALVIGLPNNLSPFVEAGVMLGADGAEGIAGALERLLYDHEVRVRLDAAAHAFVEQYGLRGQGSAAAAAAHVILEMGPH